MAELSSVNSIMSPETIIGMSVSDPTLVLRWVVSVHMSIVQWNPSERTPLKYRRRSKFASSNK